MRIATTTVLVLSALLTSCSAPKDDAEAHEEAVGATIVDLPAPGSTALPANAAAMDDDAQPDEPVVETNAP